MASTDLVVNLHHLPHTVTAVLGDGSDLAVRVRYSWEQPRILGSAGGPRQALDIIGEDTFLIVNGDTLTDLDLRALVDATGRTPGPARSSRWRSCPTASLTNTAASAARTMEP